MAACAGTLARYEGWFLLPFVALYFAAGDRETPRRPSSCCSALSRGLGPLYWLAHNWWLNSDPLDFYSGPYSAAAPSRAAPPIRAGRLAHGAGSTSHRGVALRRPGLAGWAGGRWRRRWPSAPSGRVLLLALPGVFYIWSMHSSGTPIFCPVLPPELTTIPATAWRSAAAGRGPRRWWPDARAGAPLGQLLVMAAARALAVPSEPCHWVTWEESRVNSEARREWTRQAAEYLASATPRLRYSTSFGDITGDLPHSGHSASRNLHRR